MSAIGFASARDDRIIVRVGIVRAAVDLLIWCVPDRALLFDFCRTPMAEDNAVYPESTRSQVHDALQGFSTDELRQLLVEIEQFLSVEAVPRRPRLRLAGGTYVNEYTARANIDHYLDLLKRPDVPTNTRSMLNKRLLEEEDKLGRRLEQLEFAESRAAACRDRGSPEASGGIVYPWFG
ncbi:MULTISPECIES: hypothetical protein [Bradyrhizobium]|nr:hypothetical protein [Bradyrhizobium elkanii]WLA80890.1 hypothetical protein QNJ99_36780 [Bradyrhizobium elkanii]